MYLIYKIVQHHIKGEENEEKFNNLILIYFMILGQCIILIIESYNSYLFI